MKKFEQQLLRSILNEKYLGETEKPKMTKEEKKAFLEAVSQYHKLGEMVYRNNQLSELSETLSNIVTTAQTASFVANAQSASNTVTAQTASFANTFTVASTLTVRYLTGGGVGSNIEANTLINLNTANTKFNNVNLNSTTANYVFNSLATNNLEAASGGRGGDTLEEIRQNTLALIASQKRSVTADDYLVRALSMPSDYGSISKAFIEQPKRTLFWQKFFANSKSAGQSSTGA